MGTLRTLVTIAMMASVTLVAEAMAQTQAPPAGQTPEKVIQGRVRSIDPAGAELTLTDGTRLIAPPGASIRPGTLTAGMTVIASYREENGDKVMTDLTVEEPAASPPTDPRPPADPSPVPAPPRDSPKRY
jgi:uncharacterized protein DUF1344